MRHYRVLFVCIGNACRSQMAEAFARVYGSDILVARSAGLCPAGAIPSVTQRLMLEKNISLEGCRPKDLEEAGEPFDVVVNMSGVQLPGGVRGAVREWKVEDPIRSTEERHREVRDQIERLVQALITELRRQRAGVRTQ